MWLDKIFLRNQEHRIKERNSRQSKLGSKLVAKTIDIKLNFLYTTQDKRE